MWEQGSSLGSHSVLKPRQSCFCPHHGLNSLLPRVSSRSLSCSFSQRHVIQMVTPSFLCLLQGHCFLQVSFPSQWLLPFPSLPGIFFWSLDVEVFGNYYLTLFFIYTYYLCLMTLNVIHALAGVAQWIERGLWTKGSPVRFPVRAHAWFSGQIPSGDHVRGNHALMFLSLSFSLSSPPSKNK